jgi:hypothetical protein
MPKSAFNCSDFFYERRTTGGGMKYKDRYVLVEGWYTYDEDQMCLWAFRSPEYDPKTGNIKEKAMKWPKILDRNDAPKYRLVLERVD